MLEYVKNNLNISNEQAYQLCILYWKKYGATVYGLSLHHHVNPAEFLKFSHPIKKIQENIPKSPSLQSILQCIKNMQYKIYIISNGPSYYVRAALFSLGLLPYIIQYFGIDDMNYYPKPSPRGFHTIFNKIGCSPAQCILIDDVLENVQSAQNLGCIGLWYTPTGYWCNKIWPIHGNTQRIISFAHLPQRIKRYMG